ncbi:MAG: discoidin domain-containing protein [Elusimicrobia bacterium]|nr:discoidin domain-containing protein [Elusimicrobiota bacterium]
MGKPIKYFLSLIEMALIKQKKYFNLYFFIFFIILVMTVSSTIDAAAATKLNSIFYEGGTYPSPNLAPISSPYFIFWFREGSPEVNTQQPHVTAVDCNQTPSESRYNEMINQGKIAMAEVLLSNISEDAVYNEYKTQADKGFNFSIDELGSGYYYQQNDPVRYEYGYLNLWAFRSLRKLKQEYPNLFVQAWTTFNLSPLAVAGMDVIDIFSPELYINGATSANSYVNVVHNYETTIDTYVYAATLYGVEGKTVIGLDAGCWFNNVNTFGTTVQVDARLQYLRSKSPQIASNGISLFWISNTICPCGNPYRAQFDALMDKNFYKLSPTALINTPANGATVSGTVTINVTGNVNTTTNSPVTSYRYFVDNKLVKISSLSTYSWDTAGYSPGNHIITVHAVSADYMGGAKQITVNIPTGLNLALNKTATASSNVADTGKAVDGNLGSNWTSSSSDPQWLCVDLGGEYNLTGAILKWGTNYGKGYRIQVSTNNINWQNIYIKINNGTGGTENIILSGNGRYVRMYGTSRGTTNGYSLNEFEIYGIAPAPDTTSPATINTLAAGNATSNSIVLGWTSVGDDGNSGTANAYDIRYSNVNITDSNWSTTTQCSGEPTPLVAGSNQSYTVQGLSAGITYYFAMKVRDEVPNWSGISNVVSKATNAPDTTAPSSINTLVTGVATSNSIVLSWTSVGDDGNIGTASVYDIRYSNVNITDSNWATAIQCSGEPTPSVAGSNQSYTVQGLSAGITYYFGMKVGDEIPNWSGISNIVNGQTNNQGNLAIGKTATASSLEGTAGRDESAAIDGNQATRWASDVGDPQWIKIDLVETYNINQVILRWEDAYGKDYQLQVSSNNINWTTIYTKTGGTGGVETLSGLNGSGRYIRMYGTARGTIYGYSLWEFEVYGTPVTTPTKSITITYPNGGENLIAGSQQTVTWTSVGITGNVTIQISVDGGTNWSTLATNIADDGSEVVTLPNSASSSCLIRIVEIIGGTTDSSNTNFAITVTGQMSFGNNGNPWLIGTGTTTIEAENYDTGGEAVAYHDTTPGNSGNAYRTNEDVDVETCIDTGGGYNIGFAVPTEWLEYSVNINETAEYKIIIRGAMQGTASPVHLEFGNHNLVPYETTPSVAIPNTGGWQTWQDVEVSSNTALTAGNQIMKLVLDTGAGSSNGNFNYIKIIRLTADTTPPVVSAPTPGNISGSGIVITWTTNEPANSKVEYGLTTSYGSATPVTDTGGVYSHSVTLSNLTENTVYHYRMVSVDMNGNPTTTADYSFTTTANDTTPPVISNISAGVTQNSAIITWNTDEDSDSQVAYGLTSVLGSTTTLDTTATKLHSVSLNALLKGKTYYYKVLSKDTSGNLTISTQNSFKTCNIKYRIYTYYYDEVTTPASLKFKLQVYNLDEGSLATDYTSTLTLTTKNSNNSILDTTDSTLTVSDSGEKDVSIPFRSDITTVELTGDVTAPVVVNFNDMYTAKLVGYQGGTIRGANGLKIIIPTGVLSANKYLAAIRTSIPPAANNTTKYVNTVNPICYDFGELTFGESAPVLENQVFTRAVNITIPYTASDVGTLNEAGLRIYYWTGTDWDLVTGVQTVDKVNNTVTATVRHFSTYRILGSYVSTDLNDIKIYPNPYNPDTAAQGKLKVINLPTNSVMKLYSVDGELIRELKELDFGNLGWLEWDGKNADGDKVARAVYIYQIEDTAGGKKTGKIGLVK